MTLFLETLGVTGGVVLAIVAGVVILTLFYRCLAWINDAGTKPETMAIRGILKKDTWATVHLVGGQVFERVRFLGFANSESMKMRFPFELNGMVILEGGQQKQFLIRARSIQMIVIAPEPVTT